MAFVLHLDDAGNPDFLCSGTVVAPNVVLTAGHCAVDETTGATLAPSGFGVVTGSVDWSNQSRRQLSLVSKVIVDPSYVPGLVDSTDAALLVLATPTTAPTIALATTPEANLALPGAGGFIAGWGTTYQGGPPVTSLQWASTVVQSAGYCARVDPEFAAASESCAVNPPDLLTGSCNGDSGGPLAARSGSGALVEIGVITHGPADCDTGTADYFTSVIPIEPWVASWIQAVAPPPSPPPSPSPPGPAPPVSSPPTLPTLALVQANNYVRQTVAGALGQRANPAHSYRAKCSRRSSTRIACAVQFWHGPNDYYGTVTVYLVGAKQRSRVDRTYTLHWVNDRCYFPPQAIRGAARSRRGAEPGDPASTRLPIVLTVPDISPRSRPTIEEARPTPEACRSSMPASLTLHLAAGLTVFSSWLADIWVARVGAGDPSGGSSDSFRSGPRRVGGRRRRRRARLPRHRARVAARDGAPQLGETAVSDLRLARLPSSAHRRVSGRVPIGRFLRVGPALYESFGRPWRMLGQRST